MVFNGDSNNQDICTLTDKLVKTDAIDFPLSEKALYANWGMREIWQAIYKAYGGWILDDRNATTIPESIGNLTLNQFYPLPDDLQALHSVEVMDASLSWRSLKVITLEDILARGSAETEFMKIPANPEFYRPLANGFKLYPASDTARALAIRIKFTRDIVAFTPTSTNVSPGYDSTFHEDLSLFMGMTYADINTLTKRAARLQQQWTDFIARLTSHYASKAKQLFPPSLKKSRDMVAEYVS